VSQTVITFVFDIVRIIYFCILRGPGGERIVDVPGGTELEPRVKTGSWAGCTNSQLFPRPV